MGSHGAMYRPLPHAHCTRVLEILSSNPSEQNKLVVRMTVVDVSEISSLLHEPDDDTETNDDNVRRFDALSYTWGAPISTPECDALYGPANDVDITVIANETETYSVKIGRNLYEALHQIHATTLERPVWVDAICINQADLKEKEKHILLMSDIYSKAWRVIVWLGRDDLAISEFKHVLWFHTTVLDAIEKHMEQNGPLGRTDFSAGLDGGVVIMPMDGYLLPDEALNALYHFYAYRRYLSRAWVMQEVALSHDCIVLLGEHELDFQRLSDLPLRIGDLGGLSNFYIQGGSPTHPAMGTELAALGINAEQIHGWKSSTMASDLRSIFGAYDEITSYLALLEYQLESGSQRLATNPLDLIYCLLGMAKAVHPNVDDPIKPDYTSATDDVYTRFTATLLERLPHRTVLSLVTEKPKHADYVQRLPSWVPDFVTSTGNNIPILYRNMVTNNKLPGFRAGFDDARFSHLNIDGRTLSLFGRRCSQVDFTFRLFSVWGGSRSATVLRDIKLVTGIIEASLQMVQKGMSDLLEPMLRIICWESSPISQSQDFFSLWRKFLTTAIVEPSLTILGDPEIVAATSRLKILYNGLVGVPFIPVEGDFKREEETLALFRILGGEVVADIVAAIQKLKALWPEHFTSVDGSENEDGRDEDLDEQEFDKFLAFHGERLDPRSGQHDTFFTTSERHVGRITGSLRPGDELWLLCQAKVPFVLRPTPTGEYLLVGEAFVYGAMMGELIEKGAVEQPREIKIV